jgi:hypothetical protein
MRCDYFRMCYMVRCGGFYVDADEYYQGGDCTSLFQDDLLKVQPLCYDTSTDCMVPVDVFARRENSPHGSTTSTTTPSWLHVHIRFCASLLLAPPGYSRDSNAGSTSKARPAPGISPPALSRMR